MKRISAYKVPMGRLVAGYENNRDIISSFIRNSSESICLVADKCHPEIELRLGWLKHETDEARKRGTRIYQIVDVTWANLRYCESLASRIDELRHLTGLRAFFGVSDKSFLGMVLSISSGDAARVQFLDTNLQDIIDLKQLVFDTLWNKAEPAQSRFYELKFGERIKGTTKEKIGEYIDRFYRCSDCNAVFVFLSEIREHGESSGHSGYREYPLS